MSRPKQDVLIHYDEERQELIFSTVSSEDTVELRSKNVGVIRPSTEELRAMAAEEAMRRVGGTVLALLDLSSRVKLGVTAALTANVPPSSEA